jgi:Kef-type K+ transport system membrane component KefB
MVILSVACVSKIVPVYFAARHGSFLRSDALSCDVLMNTRAPMEFIVLKTSAINWVSFHNLFSQ